MSTLTTRFLKSLEFTGLTMALSIIGFLGITAIANWVLTGNPFTPAITVDIDPIKTRLFTVIISAHFIFSFAIGWCLHK